MKNYIDLINEKNNIAMQVMRGFLSYLNEKGIIENDEKKSAKFIKEVLVAQNGCRPLIKPVFVARNKSPHPENQKGLSNQSIEEIICATKTSGVPLLLEGEKWPICASCVKPMKLIYQLNMQQITDDTDVDFGNDIIQWFQCDSDYISDCNPGYEKLFFSKDNLSLVRGDDSESNNNRFITLRVIPIQKSNYWDDTYQENVKYFEQHPMRSVSDGYIFRNIYLSYYELLFPFFEDVDTGDHHHIKEYFGRIYGDQIGYDSEFEGWENDNGYFDLLDHFYKFQDSINKEYNACNLRSAGSYNGFTICSQYASNISTTFPTCPICREGEMEVLVKAARVEKYDSYTHLLFRCRRHTKKLALRFDTFRDLFG